jgi:formate dehydrogenase subunit delta
MTDEQLVHRANQIALFFASRPHEEAVAGVTDHIRSFWEKRIREQLTAYAADGGGDLHDLVREAAQRL